MDIRTLFLFFLVLCFPILIFAEDYYYRVLELNQDATEADIKKAFRRLSIKYHPDKNPGDQESAQKYLEINKAYEILTDPEKKQLYDLYGEEGSIISFFLKFFLIFSRFNSRRC